MVDLLLKGVRLLGESRDRELAVLDGLIVEPELEARQVIDLGGSLVTPALVEPHIHLDAVLTVGEPRQNVSGSLFEGIAIWAERVKDLTVEDVKRRVRTVLRWQLANGVQFVRSHVDVCDPELRAVRALVELRQEIGDQMVLQLVAFPQQGIMSFEGGEQLMRRAIQMGVDVVGAIPHFELTRE
jgi:cytosine deaminase